MDLRVAVLMGGVSSERDVSLRSGRAVARALRERDCDVIEVDLTEEDIGPVQACSPDVVFIALHGRFGEDGGVQAQLEEAGLPYTGSDAQASRAGMDKMASKCFFVTHDIATPPFRLVTTTQQWDRIGEAAREIGLPLVVKPLRQGSSIGVTVAKDEEALAIGLAKAFKYGYQALLERYVPGREFTVGILGETPLPVIEIRTARPFFTNDAKYADEATEFITQPDLDLKTRERLQAMALTAHEALGCRHFSRVDMMIESDGSPYVLEVNTVPGMTERSLFPLAARAAGVSFPDVCLRIAQMAAATQAPAKAAVA